ncbi:MAG TPA: hypothetical protein VNS32_18935 [Flavisolibacter sp.]|nr:hypothetical protein [Flavisolibacter sp.]
MGLDIQIRTDQDDKILEEIHSDDSIKLRGTLSRSFLPFIYREHEPNDEELSQISEITGIDLMPLIEMGLYPDSLDEEYQLSTCESDEEKRKVQDKLNASKLKYAKPIDSILETLNRLDNYLKSNPEYYKELKLSDTSEESLRYFKNYSLDPEPTKYGLISHSDATLGVDIRAMIKYLEFAKSRQATITHFSFG